MAPGDVDETTRTEAVGCPDCGRTFADRAALKSHECGAAPAGRLCRQCGQRFETERAFKEHEALHMVMTD